MNDSKTLVLNNVTINWPKLVTPVSPFGELVWEFQMATTDESESDDWKANHFNVKKMKDGSGWFVNVNKKATLNSGKEAKPVSYTHLTLPTICSV